MSEIGRLPSVVNLPPRSGQGGGSTGTETKENPVEAPASTDALARTPAVAYAGSGVLPEVRSGCVVGLDGGGTKVNVAVADLDGKVLGGGTAGPCNIAAMSAPDAFKSARAACLAALVSAGKLPEDVVAVCAGVAGVSHAERRVEFAALVQELFPNARVAVDPDYAIAFTGATGGAPGIVVIAGTGSVAYGENGAGLGHKTGGYGYLIDDSGSGYGVGREALDAVLRAADKSGPPTVLLERILDALAIDEVGAIVPGVYGGAITRVKIAALATVVADAADVDADPVAQSILGRAGSSLATLAITIAAEIFPAAADPFPIAMVGSLWKAGNSITVPFIRAIRDAAPTAVLAPEKSGALQGALLRAHALAQ